MQLALSCLCFIIPDFWHKAHTNEGEKQRKDNTIKHPGAVRLDFKQPNSHEKPQLRRTFTKYLMADAYAWACMDTLKFPWYFQNHIVLWLPWSIYSRCKMQCAKLPSHTLWQIPALRAFTVCPGGTTKFTEGFTQLEGKTNKAPAGEGFFQFALTKKATAFH